MNNTVWIIIGIVILFLGFFCCSSSLLLAGPSNTEVSDDESEDPILDEDVEPSEPDEFGETIIDPDADEDEDEDEDEDKKDSEFIVIIHIKGQNAGIKKTGSHKLPKPFDISEITFKKKNYTVKLLDKNKKTIEIKVNDKKFKEFEKSAKFDKRQDNVYYIVVEKK